MKLTNEYILVWLATMAVTPDAGRRERELFIDDLLVRIHLIIEMIWWTGFVPDV